MSKPNHENRATCGLCGEPMPEGEEMFKYHGYSGPCPTPTPTQPDAAWDDLRADGGLPEAQEAAAKWDASQRSSQPLTDADLTALEQAAKQTLVPPHPKTALAAEWKPRIEVDPEVLLALLTDLRQAQEVTEQHDCELWRQDALCCTDCNALVETWTNAARQSAEADVARLTEQLAEAQAKAAHHQRRADDIDALYALLGVPADGFKQSTQEQALMAVTGLKARVKFTEAYESLLTALRQAQEEGQRQYDQAVEATGRALKAEAEVARLLDEQARLREAAQAVLTDATWDDGLATIDTAVLVGLETALAGATEDRDAPKPTRSGPVANRWKG